MPAGQPASERDFLVVEEHVSRFRMKGRELDGWEDKKADLQRQLAEERGTTLIGDVIAQAEALALQEVKNLTVDIAVAAGGRLDRHREAGRTGPGRGLPGRTGQRLDLNAHPLAVA